MTSTTYNEGDDHVANNKIDGSNEKHEINDDDDEAGKDIEASEYMDGFDEEGNTFPGSQEDEIDGSEGGYDSRFGDVSYRPRSLVLYSPPLQRQRWGETQILPRVNWGDLFFDLFYVAAAYNISNIIVASPSRFGLLYSVGTYWPLHGFGFHKTYYDARFVFDKEDAFHRLFQILHFVVLSVAVLAIRPVYIMAIPTKYPNMFVFSLALTMDRFMAVSRYAEVYFFGVGEQPALKQTGLREAMFSLIPLPFYLASAALAGLDFMNGKHSEQHNSLSNSSYGYQSSSSNYSDTYNTTLYDKNESQHRFLAEASASNEATVNESTTTYPINHLPIYLCLFGYVAYMFLFSINVIFCFPSDGKHKELSIPLNVGFVIHRTSEWIMLNLGESIISLLIVDLPNQSNPMYSTFYCGILTVAFLHILHFRSQPLHADHHAMRRSKNAGVLVNALLHFYTLALVSLGAAYTVFLVPLQQEDKGTRRSRMRGLITSSFFDDNEPISIEQRILAGSSSSVGEQFFDADRYNERVAQLFCMALALIYLTLDLTTLCHLGFKEMEERCYCKKAGANKKGFVLIAMRILLMFFTATMYFWERRPKILSILGLLTVLLQIWLRKMGALILRSRRDDQLHKRRYYKQKLRCVAKKMIKKCSSNELKDVSLTRVR